MTEFDSKHWEERAEEARTLAEGMADAGAREKMLQIAASYKRMALRAMAGSQPEHGKAGAEAREAAARHRIMVVDDNEADRYAITRIIKDAGFDVVEAWDYREALRVLEDGKPLALLVIDVVLPSITGFALGRMARMQRPEIKTIHVSAYDVPGGQAVSPVLRKPVAAQELLMHVRDALGS